MSRPRCIMGSLHAEGPGEPVLSEAVHLLLIIVQLHVQLVVQRVSAVLTQETDGATGEEHNPLQLFIVEKVIERPEASFFTERIRVQVRVVAVNVTARQVDLLVHGAPQLRSKSVELFSHSGEQAAVDCIHHPVKTGLAAELVSPGGAEVIVRSEGLVECGDEVEDGLPATLVTQRVLPIITALTQLAGADSAGGLRGGQGLQDMGLALLAELLEHVLIVPRHLARVALDPAKYAGVPSFYTQSGAHGLKAGVFQKLHCDLFQLHRYKRVDKNLKGD